MHDAGYVHLDIKLENFLINATTERIMLADFGLSKKIPELEKTPSYVGSLGYVAPELNILYPNRAMPITPAADVFSLGVMIFMVSSFRLINSS